MTGAMRAATESEITIVGGGIGGDADGAQLPHQDLAIDRMIVDHQHLATLEGLFTAAHAFEQMLFESQSDWR